MTTAPGGRRPVPTPAQLLVLGFGHADRAIGSAENGAQIERCGCSTESAHAAYEVEAVQRDDGRASGEERQAQPARDLAVDM